MKKKILSLCLVIALAATAVIGGTLAYFTDTDAQTNTFTVGNVKIDLVEDFNTEELELIPAVGGTTDDEGLVYEYKNTIEKEVYVQNEGSQPAYVRVHIAIPAIKDGTNVLALLYDDMTTLDWSWNTSKDGANYPAHDGANASWNFYKQYKLEQTDDAGATVTDTKNIEIEGVPYKVFCVTNEKALESKASTIDAIHKVYMDPATTQEEIAAWDVAYGEGKWAKIYVVAEAVQAEGFNDAFEALNAAFGVPGTYEIEGWTAVDVDEDKDDWNDQLSYREKNPA